MREGECDVLIMLQLPHPNHNPSSRSSTPPAVTKRSTQPTTEPNQPKFVSPSGRQRRCTRSSTRCRGIAAGRFQLVPCTFRFVFGYPSAPGGGAAEAGRCRFKRGNLERQQLSHGAILQVVSRRSPPGVLQVEAVAVIFSLKAGTALSAALNASTTRNVESNWCVHTRPSKRTNERPQLVVVAA